jgi:hypothetical protein
MKGKELKTTLGLDKFKFVQCQKIINISNNVFVLTFDSRFPTVWIGYNRISKLKSNVLKKISGNKLISYILTPPVLLDQLQRDLPQNSLLVIRDIAGEYYKRGY